MFKGFRDFVLRGNVVDLAVGVVVGAAFGAVVTGLVGDIITPLVAAIGGTPDFSALHWTVNSSVIKYGAFVNAIVSFLVIMAAVYFLVVLPVSKLLARVKRDEVATERPCPECLTSVPVAAKRCSACTSELPAA